MGGYVEKIGKEMREGDTMTRIIYCMKKTSIKNKFLVLIELCKILLVSLNCEAGNVFAYIDFNQKLPSLLLRELTLGKSRTQESRG